MQTFTKARDLGENPHYRRDRRRVLAELDEAGPDHAGIDPPLVDIVSAFRDLPHAFTLQCCWGHFLWRTGQDSHNLERLPDDVTGPVRYRIAYLALCLENSERGRDLVRALARIPDTCPGFLQFGSADWFRQRWPNSYVLQAGPAAHREVDEAVLDAGQARQTQAARNLLFQNVRKLLTGAAGHAREMVLAYQETGRFGRITKHLRKLGFTEEMETILHDSGGFGRLKKADQVKYVGVVVDRMVECIGQENTERVLHECGAQCCGKSWSGFARRIWEQSPTLEKFVENLLLVQPRAHDRLLRRRSGCGPHRDGGGHRHRLAQVPLEGLPAGSGLTDAWPPCHASPAACAVRQQPCNLPHGKT